MKRFFPLYLATFLAYVGYAMSLPLFSAMMLDKIHPIVPDGYTLGDRTTLLGLLLCTYPLGQFLGAPILGSFSDTFGRKPVLLTSLVCVSFLYAGVGLAIHLELLPLLFLLLFCAGLLEGSIGITQSFIADRATGHTRTVAFGYTYSSGAIGFIVGSLLAGELSAWISYSAPFYLLSILLLVATVPVGLMVHHSKRERPKGLHLARAFLSFRILFAHKVLRWTFVISFLFYVAIFGSLAGFSIYATTTYNLTAQQLAFFICFLAALIFLTTIVAVPRLPRGRSTHRTAALAAICLGAFMALVPLAPTASSLWLFLLPLPFAIGICLTETTTMISTRALDRELGRVMGANQALLGISRATAASSAGLLAAIALPLPLIVLGLIGIVAGLLLLFRKKGKKS